MRQEFVPTTHGKVSVCREGSGRPLVLLHTNGHSWREFEDVVGEFSGTHEVIAWDMPGQGDSDPIGPGVGIDDYADRLAEVLDALDIGQAVVAGCSVGAFVAASLAARQPERVSAAGLIELQFQELGFWTQEPLWNLVEKLFAIPTQTMDQVQPRFESKIDDEHLMRWNIDRNKAGTHSMLGVMWATRAYDIAATVRQITQPVLALFGSTSPTVGSKENAAAWLHEGAEVSVVDDCGHFLTVDQPERFVSEINALLARADWAG